MRHILFFAGFCFYYFVALSQTPKDCSVELWANVQANPPSITLNWLGNATTTNYSVARKPKSSNMWTLLAASLPGTTTQYVDNTVAAATLYDYRIIRAGSNYNGFGYISSGIEIPEVDQRGKLILLIANNHSLTLAAEIKRLEEDLEGDGWIVLTSYVSPSLAVTQVKAQILATYNLDPLNTKALFLLGHVPVPYSGNINPDGHPDHLGAWPADTYYGELTGLWTDGNVTSTTASPARTQNVPGDGKFDQSVLPGAMELQVGRVDLWGMTSFSLTETQLLKNYLDKDHDYRKKVITVANAGIIDDNFGYFSGEAFAANGFKTFGPLVTPTNVVSSDYFTSMTGGTGYQWSYGCGGGSFTSASGIGQTSNFASANLQGIFTMLFGSYFGDWDVPNNFLRAPLCQGKTLTSVWAGRPHWAFHHMGMGENIGYSAFVTQNNTNTYFYNYAATYVDIALMGDPTLRNNVVGPVSNVVATKSGYNCLINWSASTETNIAGYNIYMKNDTNSTYTRINNLPVTATTYTDYCLLYPGTYKYMVRALKLETTPSGSYYNMSEGVADTAYNSSGVEVVASFTSMVSGNSLNVTNTSTNATTYLWDFGNGNTGSGATQTVTYTANGTYPIMLIASNPCASDTSYQTITIQEVGLPEFSSETELQVWPNPAIGKFRINYNNSSAAEVSVYNTEGKKVFEKSAVKPNEELNLVHLAKGIYLVTVKVSGKVESRKVVLE
ncbi:MAG: T9SS type A sorting domain-containing protein [Bacteroidota bacterium]